MNLTIFDVEHGACGLLTCDNGMRIMIDCGHNASSGWRPGDYLRSIGVSYLDMLVVTNYDEDHVSGLLNLREKIEIGWLWRNKSVSPDTLRLLKSRDGMGPGIDALVQMSEMYVDSDPPTAPPFFPGIESEAFCLNYPEFEDENNLSLVLYLNIAGVGFLFPGDLEANGWNALLSRNSRFRHIVSKLSVLVASHHGRESGVCNELFDSYGCSPYWVVISDKGYAHDTQNTIPFYSSKVKGSNFRGRNRSVLSTRSDGSISFNFENNSWCAS